MSTSRHEEIYDNDPAGLDVGMVGDMLLGVCGPSGCSPSR
jgi:hypothetical protein